VAVLELVKQLSNVSKACRQLWRRGDRTSFYLFSSNLKEALSKIQTRARHTPTP
jgi:hypothetical protein